MDLNTLWELAKVTICLWVVIILFKKSKKYRDYD